jgi:hypothetical protein
MQMVYNSDSYVVVQFDAAAVSTAVVSSTAAAPTGADAEPVPLGLPLGPGGFEIVDKQGRADVFLHGAVAERFQRGAQALMQDAQGEPDMAVLDDYIAGFTTLGRQPLALH